jgi:hypothetical protein
VSTSHKVLTTDPKAVPQPSPTPKAQAPHAQAQGSSYHEEDCRCARCESALRAFLDADAEDAAESAAPAEPKEDKRYPPERMGEEYFSWMKRHLEKHHAQCLVNEAGQPLIILEGEQIHVDAEDWLFQEFMVKVCKVGTTSPAARPAIQRLSVYVHRKAGKVTFRTFSTIHAQRSFGKCLYVPIQGGKMLRIRPGNLDVALNGSDGLWLTHPKDEPFEFARQKDETAQAGLADFERLCVDTQACLEPMRWFVAMHEGLFPFVRDLCSARFIVIHQAPSQHGKTTGAQRFTLLHGLGEVDGDSSIAALANEADPGLQVLDNKESANLTQSLNDYLLFLSTGAARKRSNSDGSMRSNRKTRPAAVLTSIEGADKRELLNRCVAVTYRVTGLKVDREAIEQEIAARRNVMLSALMHVLQRFLTVREQRMATPNPFDGNFGTHFTALADLLRAFGQLAGKPEGWSEKLIGEWVRIIRPQFGAESDESVYEFTIRAEVIEHRFNSPNIEEHDIVYERQAGRLYVVGSGWLHWELSKNAALKVPSKPNQLARRLMTEKFHGFKVLKHGDAPEVKQRTLGIFVPKAS